MSCVAEKLKKRREKAYLSEDEIKQKLKTMQSEKRYRHTLGVAEEAERLASVLGADRRKARLAGLLHDCAKNLDEKFNSDFASLAKKYRVELDLFAQKEKALAHAFLGAEVARVDYGIDDEEILSAIYYHTTGRENMSVLEKIIYLADITETGRNLQTAAVARNMAQTDFDGALIYAIGSSIKHVIDKGGILHPYSIYAINYLNEQRRSAN